MADSGFFDRRAGKAARGLARFALSSDRGRSVTRRARLIASVAIRSVVPAELMLPHMHGGVEQMRPNFQGKRCRQ